MNYVTDGAHVERVGHSGGGRTSDTSRSRSTLYQSSGSRTTEQYSSRSPHSGHRLWPAEITQDDALHGRHVLAMVRSSVLWLRLTRQNNSIGIVSSDSIRQLINSSSFITPNGRLAADKTRYIKYTQTYEDEKGEMHDKMRDWQTHRTIKIYTKPIKIFKRKQTCRFVPDHVFNFTRRHYNITTDSVLRLFSSLLKATAIDWDAEIEVAAFGFSCVLLLLSWQLVHTSK